MFKPFFLYVGYKYVLSKYDNYFISFVSLMSMLGIALGVAVLITVLSVMNGFNKEIKNNILTFTPHIVMHDMQSSLKNWSFLYKQIIKTPGVISASPYIISQCFILDTSSISIIQQPTVMHGIDPKIVNNKQHQHHLYSIITNSMVIGSFDDLIAGKFNIVLGSNLATSLHLTIGDKVICLISKSNANINEDPNIKEFTVVGIFNTNTHYNNNAFINIKDIAYILKMKDSVSNIHIQVNDAMQSTKIIETLKTYFNHKYWFIDWSEDHKKLFEALNMEKSIMWCILCLIISVATFNLITSLMIIVTNKRSDIAILRTIGATPFSIMKIFMAQGLIIGIVGTLLGAILGILSAYNITSIAKNIQSLFNIQFISEDVYFIGFVPSQIHNVDLIWVCSFSIFMSFLSTIYPAWNAANTSPAEALRYE